MLWCALLGGEAGAAAQRQRWCLYRTPAWNPWPAPATHPPPIPPLPPPASCSCIKAFGRDNGCCGCPANMNDAGCFCYPTTIWKSSYGRGVGTVPGIRNKQSISRIVIPTVTLPN